MFCHELWLCLPCDFLSSASVLSIYIIQNGKAIVSNLGMMFPIYHHCPEYLEFINKKPKSVDFHIIHSKVIEVVTVMMVSVSFIEGWSGSRVILYTIDVFWWFMGRH